MPKKYVVKYDPTTQGDEVRAFALKRLIDEICRMKVAEYGFNNDQSNRVLSILGIEIEESEEPRAE